MSTTLQRTLLAAIVVFQVVLGAGYALGTPAWENPDEPAHYNYIRFLALQRQIPVMQPGDYDAAQLEVLKADRFPPGVSVDGVRYENHQPPLYYALMAPLFLASQGLPVAQQVVVLRLVSVLLLALVLGMTFLIARRLFPADAVLALGVPAFLAVIPMHTAMGAAINNDTLSELLLAVLLYLSLLRADDAIPSRRYVLLAGVVFGLGLLTKVTVYVGIVVLAAAELARWLRFGSAGRASLLRSLMGAAVPLAGISVVSLAVGGWWFVRNALVYGNLDILARQRHDLVVQGQPRTVWGWDALQHFVVTTFDSFWGQFGWMGIPLDQRLYHGLLVITILASVGLVLYLARRPWRGDPRLGWGLALVVILFLVIFAGMAQYNLDYIQPQGRYLFPAAVTVALGHVLGLREVAGRVRLCTSLLAAGVAWLALQGAGRVATGLGVAAVLLFTGLRWRWTDLSEPVLVGGVLAALAVLNVYCLVAVVAPYFG